MKKLIAISIMAVAAISFANTIGVPFFLDRGADDGVAFPAPGEARVPNTRTFIGVKNFTSEAKTLTVNYFTADGSAADADPGNTTYVLAANAGVGFRPYGNDAATEGVGVDVPNSSSRAGSCTIFYMGEDGDVGGRVLTTEPEGQSAYLII